MARASWSLAFSKSLPATVRAIRLGIELHLRPEHVETSDDAALFEVEGLVVQRLSRLLLRTGRVDPRGGCQRLHVAESPATQTTRSRVPREVNRAASTLWASECALFEATGSMSACVHVHACVEHVERADDRRHAREGVAERAEAERLKVDLLTGFGHARR